MLVVRLPRRDAGSICFNVSAPLAARKSSLCLYSPIRKSLYPTSKVTLVPSTSNVRNVRVEDVARNTDRYYLPHLFVVKISIMLVTFSI